MTGSNSENATATDTATADPIAMTTEDPSVKHFLADLQEKAKAENAEQRKVLGAWSIDGVEGERVLVVQPDGTYSVEEVSK